MSDLELLMTAVEQLQGQTRRLETQVARLQRIDTAGGGPVSEAAVTNPPLESELEGAMGAATDISRGMLKWVDDGGAGDLAYGATTINDYWWYWPLIKAGAEAVGPSPLLSVFLTLPALRGFWPMTSMGDSGAAIDLSGQARTLTNNNSAQFAHANNIGHAALASASSQYFSRTDEAGLSILGNEAYVASAIQGLTLGGWFWCNAAGTNQGFFDKGTGINQSFRMWRNTSNLLNFQVSADGSSTTGLSGGDSPAITANGWFFCVGRYVPSSPLRVYVNNVVTVAGGNAPAAPLFDSTAAFEIGRFNGSNYLNGRSALCFACAAAVPESRLTALYEQSRGFFGV